MKALWIRFATWMEHIIVTRIVPKRVGPVMRILFKTPILFYRWGLGSLFEGKILILVTLGRKTGFQRMTPLEYSYFPETKQYLLMSGWNGKSDWYRNALACPRVEIWVGRKRFPGIAEPASNEDVVGVMEEVMQINPKAVNTWSTYSGEAYDGTRESLSRMAKAFPSLLVRANHA